MPVSGCHLPKSFPGHRAGICGRNWGNASLTTIGGGGCIIEINGKQLFDEQGGPVTGYSPREVTLLLQDWCRGDRAALNKLVPLVYDQLHRLAHIYMVRERPGHTLQTSALVNEAYLRLIDAKRIEWKDRIHFFAVSANVMRRILVEFARARGSLKRGGVAVKVDFDTALIPSSGRDRVLVALDDALNELAKIDPREARVVELRFFGGLSEKETAEVVGVTDRTVRHDWNHAKAWLMGELKRGAQ